MIRCPFPCNSFTNQSLNISWPFIDSPPWFQIEGFVYDVSPDERLYEIAAFDTLADAEKFLADLVAKLNEEAKNHVET